MLVEPGGGGLRERESETRPYAERTLTVTTKLERFTLKAREEPQTRFTALMGLLWDLDGLRASFGRQDGRKAPGVDGVTKASTTSTPSLGGRLRLGAGWCNTPSPVLRGAGCRTVAWQRYCGPAGKPGGKQRTPTSA
jgi:hypothetical protein